MRNYCQVKPNLAISVRDGIGTVSDTNPHGQEQRQSSENTRPDAALTCQLRCLLLGLNADIAMISLLDEHTQYFLAGCGKESVDSTINPEFTGWYGFDRVSHHGGLGERTIAMDSTQRPAIYEELDMAGIHFTKDLPFVNGILASFRHYAGAPLTTSAGVNIGTVFVMSKQPSSGLSAFEQTPLTDTAENVMRQLAQTLQALEGERLVQFQSAATSLLQRQQQSDRPRPTELRKQSISSHQPGLEVYEYSAIVMGQSLQLDGLIFQQTVPTGRVSQSTSEASQDHVLAAWLRDAADEPPNMADCEIDRLVQSFPRGGLLSRLEGDCVMSTTHGSWTALDREVSDAISESFKDGQQLLVMPLFDFFHNRTTAICVGWRNSYDRVSSE